MADELWRNLESTIYGLAADSILIQQRLDLAARQGREEFSALLAAVPADLRSLITPLCPPALVVRAHSVRCVLRVTTAHTTAFSLLAAPLHLGYHALYQTTLDEQCSLFVEVVPNVSPTPFRK